MFIKKKKIEMLNKSIEYLNQTIIKSRIIELSELIGDKKEILKRNLIAGISKGVGIGIGITIITAILVIILQKIVTLNIPIIGEYIADVVEIVEKNR